jgi:hypothetical protein
MNIRQSEDVIDEIKGDIKSMKLNRDIKRNKCALEQTRKFINLMQEVQIPHN